MLNATLLETIPAIPETFPLRKLSFFTHIKPPIFWLLFYIGMRVGGLTVKKRPRIMNFFWA
jgi:hypothetical protein